MADLPEIQFKGDYGAFSEHIVKEVCPGVQSPEDWVKVIWRFGNMAWRSGFEHTSGGGGDVKFNYGPFCGRLVLAKKYFSEIPLIYLGDFMYRGELYAAVCLIQIMKREIEDLDESSCILGDLRAGRMSSLKSFSDRVFIVPHSEITNFWGSVDRSVEGSSGV